MNSYEGRTSSRGSEDGTESRANPHRTENRTRTDSDGGWRTNLEVIIATNEPVRVQSYHISFLIRHRSHKSEFFHPKKYPKYGDFNSEGE